MSGCAICVHDIYLDALNAYTSSLRSIKASLLEQSVPKHAWPSAVLEVKDGSEQDDADGLPSDLDPTTRAFMELERKLKKKGT